MRSGLSSPVVMRAALELLDSKGALGIFLKGMSLISENVVAERE